MQRSTTDGTGAIFISLLGIPFSMYQSIAVCENGARPCPESDFTSCFSASKIRSGTSPPIEQAPWSVTLSARIVPAAASAAFPSASRISIPAATAFAPPAATAPVLLTAFQPISCVFGIGFSFASSETCPISFFALEHSIKSYLAQRLN